MQPNCNGGNNLPHKRVNWFDLQYWPEMAVVKNPQSTPSRSSQQDLLPWQICFGWYGIHLLVILMGAAISDG